MQKAIAPLLLTISIIHLLPLSGFFAAARLEALYGIDVSEANLEILMRHRAGLFGILGAFFACAAFRPALQPLAFIMAFLSIGSFLYLALNVGGYNLLVRRVIVADVVAAICLLIAVGLYAAQRGN